MNDRFKIFPAVAGEPLRMEIELDDLTVARLIEVSEGCHAPMQVVAAAMIRDLLEDDAQAHAEADPAANKHLN